MHNTKQNIKTVSKTTIKLSCRKPYEEVYYTIKYQATQKAKAACQLPTQHWKQTTPQPPTPYPPKPHETNKNKNETKTANKKCNQ